MRETCVRLFSYRNAQAWSPVVEVGVDWSKLYASQLAGTYAVATVEEAVAWVNDFIARIEAAKG